MEKRGSRKGEIMLLPYRRAVRRHLRRMRRRKYRNRRRAVTAFFAAVLLYLAAIGALRDAFIRVAEEQTFQYALPPGPDGGRRTLRITFRIKSGEIIIYREEAEIHNSAPQNFIN